MLSPLFMDIDPSEGDDSGTHTIQISGYLGTQTTVSPLLPLAPLEVRLPVSDSVVDLPLVSKV